MNTDISFCSSLVKSESLLYLVMEKGESDLRKVLQSYTAPLPLYTLMKYWHQMLQAVNYIHKNDVIHSDLKPENFLVVRGRLKLIDFGISSKMAVDATSIIKFSQVGTFNYISPESLMDTSTGNSPISQKRQTKIKVNLLSFLAMNIKVSAIERNCSEKLIFNSFNAMLSVPISDIPEIRCLVIGLHSLFADIPKDTICSY